MNDLENRLRDALDGAARTIPDGASRRDLATVVDAGRGRRPPALLIAVVAAAAVVAAIAVPYVAQRDRGAAPVQLPPPCPGGASAAPALPAAAASLPAGPPPRVPYTVTNDTGSGYLQDGSTRVKLDPGRQTKVIDRLGCRWLVARTEIGKEFGTTELGILVPSGQFTRLGASASRAGGVGLSVGLSPDGTKVAYTRLAAGTTAWLTVVDLATGAEVTSRRINADTLILAWNDRGVWLQSTDSATGRRSFTRWRPGGELQPVTAQGLLYPFRTTNRMLLQRYEGTSACIRVIEAGTDGRLNDLMRSCVGGSSLGPSLSPDGTVLIHHDNQARQIPDGTVLPMPGGLTPGPYVWEDGDHVLIEVQDAGRRGIVRCQVRTGDCERVYTEASPFTLRLASQDPYRLLGF